MIKKSLHQHYQNFDYTRISIARERAGLTKKSLAELIGKKASSITQFESGKSGVSLETFERLIDALGVDAAYLTDAMRDNPLLRMEACHFRANRSVSQVDRYKAVRFAQDVLAIYGALERYGVVFPEVRFEPHEGARPTERQIEPYAMGVRKYLGLGLGPIHDMAELLESIGIRIVMLPTECGVLDAFATWVDDIPCIMIAAGSPASRMQFDYGHEFAHLLLDQANPSGDPMVERLANRFASSFLMPEATFRADCPSFYRKDYFLSVKKFWHVSMKAAIYRAKQLGIMSERQYMNAFINMSKNNIHKDEPGEFTPPMPMLLGQALELISEDITIYDLANDIGLKPDNVLDMLKSQNVPPNTIEKMLPAQKQNKILPFIKVDGLHLHDE